MKIVRGKAPLVYVAMSATQGVDVVEHPDTGKIAAAMGQAGSGKRWIFKADTQVGYFDGEPDE